MVSTVVKPKAGLSLTVFRSHWKIHTDYPLGLGTGLFLQNVSPPEQYSLYKPQWILTELGPYKHLCCALRFITTSCRPTPQHQPKLQCDFSCVFSIMTGTELSIPLQEMVTRPPENMRLQKATGKKQKVEDQFVKLQSSKTATQALLDKTCMRVKKAVSAYLAQRKKSMEVLNTIRGSRTVKVEFLDFEHLV
ncbi:hypothetical protein PM082_021590 [Marasmius tenuissimus]|nr:hypothetical protein PM082_021590 [Marasmius tenuissimus]